MQHARAPRVEFPSAPEGLRTLTPQLLIMGLVGLAATMAGAWLFPLL